MVGEGVRIAVLGIVIGGGGALGAGHWIAPLLFQVSPRDPAVFALVTTMLLVVAAMASFAPARRAARTDPNSALRAE